MPIIYGISLNQAADVLAAIGEPTIPALMEEMEIAERHQGFALSSTFTRIGEPAIPALVEALNNKLNEEHSRICRSSAQWNGRCRN